jgi:transcriptional regulator with XRE-family HTH domain
MKTSNTNLKPESPAQHRPPRPNTASPSAGSGALSQESGDGGLSLVLDTLKAWRLNRKLSLKRLEKLAAVPVQVISRLEAHDVESVSIVHLMSVAKALGAHLIILPAPPRPALPTTNEQILAEFDRLLRKGKCIAFFREQPDKEHLEVLWDVVGDVDRNWLFVVASNPKRRCASPQSLIIQEAGRSRVKFSESMSKHKSSLANYPIGC